MTFSAICTLESNTQPSSTWRGKIITGGPLTAASSAIKEAKRAYPGKRWDSLVVVLTKEVKDADKE